MDWKTEQEWVVMRYFREKYPGFPKGKLIKNESPDFRLWLIIFADYSEQEAMDLMIEEKQNGRMKSYFDKVFLFDLDTHQVIQLTK